MGLGKTPKPTPPGGMEDFVFPGESINKESVYLPFMGYYELLKNAKTFIAIDSSLSHFAQSVNKKGIVLWGGIPHWKFGYKDQVNMTNFKGKFSEFNELDPYYISINTVEIMKNLKKLMK